MSEPEEELRSLLPAVLGSFEHPSGHLVAPGWLREFDVKIEWDTPSCPDVNGVVGYYHTGFGTLTIQDHERRRTYRFWWRSASPGSGDRTHIYHVEVESFGTLIYVRHFD